MTTKICQCGSNQPRRALRDAATNLVCYACDRCEAYKRAFLGPVVVDQPGSGGEAPLEILADTHYPPPPVTGRDYCADFLADRPGNYSELM